MKLRKTLSFLMALALIVGLLPGTMITAHAEETPAWTHMSPDEEALNLASYNAETDTIAFANDPGWAQRMQYTGLDAAGKDWTIEFDASVDGGALGVYQYDASGALYGAYLDTNAARLDSIQFSDWITCNDGFYFYGDPKAPVIGANWEGNADKPASHIRVDFLRGEGGTMAGGTVNYYKQTAAGYVKIGTLSVSETVADNAELPNYFGIHLVLGTGTVSNITITEYAGAPAHPAWAHLNKAEQDTGLAVYDAATDTITFGVDGGWGARVQNMDFKAEAGKDYAIEFTLNITGGEFGVYTYDNNPSSVFGAYIDAGAGALDALHLVDGVALDDFYFREATTGAPVVHPYTATTGWDPALVNGGRIRVEFRGFSDTFPGGSATYYKQDASGKFVPMGVIPIPANMADDPTVDNYFGIQLWLGSGTISDIDIMELNADWVNMNTGEALVANPTTYDAETDTITFRMNGGWADRMQYVGLPTTAGKSWTVEFDAALAGGALGIYQYEASGAMYGAYLDVTGCAMDSVQFADWGTCTDGFFFYEGKAPEVYAANWVPETDRPASHIRADFVCGANGTMAGGTVTFYKKNLATGQYMKLGTLNVPETIVDNADLPNFFGVHLELGTGTISNMTVTEYKPINWIHMNDAEMNTGLAVYNPAEDKITFVNDPGWANRMQYTGIADAAGKDWSVEFDIALTGGALGVYQYDATGAMYGAYLDVAGSALDSVVFTDWATQTDGFYFYGDPNPPVPVVNWNPAADMAASHIMVKFVRGANGTMAGGTATFYKKDLTTGKYLTLGTLNVPETIADDPNLPNMFGMHLVLGSGTVSNIAFHNCEGAEAVRENETEATCKAGGSYDEVVYCATCGLELSRETKTTEKLAEHDVIDAVRENEVEATCTAAGSYEIVEICSLCGKLEETRRAVELPALGHTYENGVCIRCGAEEPVSGPEYNATLKFMTKSLSFQKYIGVQAIANNKNVINKFDRVYVVAKQVATDGTVRFDDVIEGRAYNGGTTYTIFEVLVESWDMTDTITITMYGEKDGITYYGESFTGSVETMALEKLASYKTASNWDACRVLVDMLNYGAKVQGAFDHNATSLPNTKLAELGYSELGTAEDPVFAATDSESGTATIPLQRMAFSMKSKVEFQMVFNATKYDISKYEVRYTVKGQTYTIPYKDFVDMKSGATTYKYAVITVEANDMREVHELALYDPVTNTPVSKVFTCSVESKAATYYNSTSASYAAYKEVVIAMLKYGDAVNKIA